jgi:UDP-N-acetylmuramoyl-tripeptide--D-alanyl-D-alanine ligase
MSVEINVEQIGLIISPIAAHIADRGKGIAGVSTDSRSIRPGELFIALRGEIFDGHQFLGDVLEKGVGALIFEQKPNSISLENITHFQVSNSLEAYQQIAHWWRSQFTIPVIGITGSVGKTSTKELIAAVLATRGEVLKTQGNYNNEIGVPKTLLEIESKHNYAVIEMAMRARGEIGLLTDIARPTIGVITNVGTAHIGRLGSEQAIAEAKCELLARMDASGVAVLNHDNQRLMNTAPRFWRGETLTYGLEGGDVQGELIDGGILRVDGLDLPLPLPGRHNAANYLAAIAVAKILGFELGVLQQGLRVELPGGRAKRHQLDGDILILDETYNAGFESMVAALHLLRETKGKRHLAVLGTMKELGEQSAQLHRRVGETVKKLGIERLLLLVDDPEAEAIATGALGVNTEFWQKHEDLVKRLTEIVEPGDRLLFKASNSVGLNRVVEGLRQALGQE